MPSSSQNPDPLSHPFSDLAFNINFCFQTWPGRNDDCHKITMATKGILDQSHILLVLSYPFGIIATLSIDDKMG